MTTSSRNPLLTAALAALILAGCQNHGTKLTFKKGEVYYTEQVTEAEATKLGNYLLEQHYFDDAKEKTVQATKAAGTYQVRMVIEQDSLKTHPEYREMFGVFTGMISTAVFAGAPVEIHLCDASLKTVETIPYQKPAAAATTTKADPASLGNKLDVGADSFFYTDAVDRPTAEKTAEYLKKDGLFKGQGMAARLDRAGDTWKLHVVFNEGAENDPSVIAKMQSKAKQISSDLFSGAPVEIHMADDAMQTRKMISSAE